MKLKAGDKIRIRRDISSNKSYPGVGINIDMFQYRGRVATIKKVVDNKYYDIDINVWAWSDDMVDLITKGDSYKIF